MFEINGLLDHVWNKWAVKYCQIVQVLSWHLDSLSLGGKISLDSLVPSTESQTAYYLINFTEM